MPDEDGSMDRAKGTKPIGFDGRIKWVVLSGGGVYGGGGDGIDAVVWSQNVHGREHTSCDEGRDLCTAIKITHLPYQLLLWQLFGLERKLHATLRQRWSGSIAEGYKVEIALPSCCVLSARSPEEKTWD